jgi:alkylation response protein AidB-like acyl-CoA dehydrogenase
MSEESTNADRLVGVAHELRPLIQRAAPGQEEARRLAPAVVEALHQHGLFRLLLPRSLGGVELELPAFGRVVEEIAQADASTAWCLCQASGCSLTAGYLNRDVADEVFGSSPGAVLAWGPGSGRAIEVSGGYRLSGRWSFASGSHHATWLGGQAAVVDAGGAAVRMADGLPFTATFLFPAIDATFHDTWQVSGLRATGSDTFSVDDLFVPASRWVRRDDLRFRREMGPLYRLPSNLVFATGFSSVALGVARSVIDAFRAVAIAKTPQGLTGPLRENAVVQAQTALAEAYVRSARAYQQLAVADVWNEVTGTGDLTLDRRMSLRLAATHAIHLATQAVDLVFHLAGSTAILNTAPFERPFRDIHAVSQQVQGRQAHYENVGRFLLGLDPLTTWL